MMKIAVKPEMPGWTRQRSGISSALLKKNSRELAYALEVLAGYNALRIGLKKWNLFNSLLGDES